MLSGLFGKASEVDAQEAREEHGEIMLENEQVQAAFKLVRDMFIFTDKRLILIDRQGLSGNKVEYISIPYKAVKHFSVETAGGFDRDSELKIWLTGDGMPTVSKEIKKGIDILGLQRALAYFVLN